MLKRKYFLRTERIGFSTWSMEDLPLAINLWGDPEVTKYVDVRGELSEDQVKEKLEKEIANYQNQNIQYWPIFLLENEQHIGCCGLRVYDQEKNILEIGFHICSESWGNGYAPEAARAIIKYAFEELKVNSLFAGHHPKNATSQKVLEKLGFKYTHHELYPPTGLDHPSYLMSSYKR